MKDLIEWLRSEADRHMGSIAWKDAAVNDHVMKLREWANTLATQSPPVAQEGDYCTVHCKTMCQNSTHGVCAGGPAQPRAEDARAAEQPAGDVGAALIERLRKTMTRLGVFPGEGLEWFAANLESNLYSLDRAVNSMLDKVASENTIGEDAAAGAIVTTALTAEKVAQAEPVAWVDEKAEVLVFGGWEKQPFAKSYRPVFYAAPHPASEPKALTAHMINQAWRDSGALSNTPPDWALQFAHNIARALLAESGNATGEVTND